MSGLFTEEDDELFCSCLGRMSSLITEEDDKTILNAFIKHTKESKPPFNIKVTNKEGFDKEVSVFVLHFSFTNLAYLLFLIIFFLIRSLKNITKDEFILGK